MQKTLAFALCAAVGTAVSAHPFGEKWQQKPVPGPVGGMDQPVELDEDFESYSVGAGITTMGGWELWPGGAVDGIATDQFASSGTMSGDWSFTGADVVHLFSGISDTGQVTFSSMTFIPTGADGSYFMIALNQWDGSGAAPGTNWSLQVQFDPFIGMVTAQFRGDTTPLIFDRWVEFRAEIDFDTNTYDLFYDDVLFAEDMSWTEAVSGGGILNFAAIDLFTESSFTGTDFFLDDVLVETSEGECFADCDGSGSLDFFDFLCFQDQFAAGDLAADCDESGTLDFFDFLCFQDAFAAGCP